MSKASLAIRKAYKGQYKQDEGSWKKYGKKGRLALIKK